MITPRLARLVVLLQLLLWGPFSARSVAQSHLDTLEFKSRDYYTRIYQSFVARILCEGHEGTAFVAALTDTSEFIFIVTNRHLVAEGTRALLRIPLGQEVGVDTFAAISTVIRHYPIDSTVPGLTGSTAVLDGLDLAVVLVDGDSLSDEIHASRGAVRFLAPEQTAHWEDMLPGQTVCFLGYPLGKSGQRGLPLFRKGTIAGFNPATDTILVDGQMFDGSSGSPVYFENSDPSCRLPLKEGRFLVGVVSGYWPLMTPLVNPKTGKTEFVKTENSGLGVVIPASRLRHMLSRLLIK
ncbi:MAG TPA: trypsin-like peptidase domain-containing protein [bacterium]|nr:trypsin-like peptidase domain-containing protein [bacterium]